VTCEIEILPENEWYPTLQQNPEKYLSIAKQLQDKLRMMQGVQHADHRRQSNPSA